MVKQMAESKKVTVEYYSGDCPCCVAPREAFYWLVNNKYRDKIEVRERNYGDNLDFAREAVAKGIWDCTTFIIGDERITEVSELARRLEEICGDGSCGCGCGFPPRK